MLRLLLQDALFGLTVAVETAALTRLIGERCHIRLEPGLDPILNAYGSGVSDRVNGVTHFLISNVSASYNDAYLISICLFFMFFIAQARRAMASDFSDAYAETGHGRDRVEKAADAVLPVLICVFGAILISFTLLPLLTPLPALWLLVQRTFFKPYWFKISRTYYANMAAVLGLTAIALYCFGVRAGT